MSLGLTLLLNLPTRAACKVLARRLTPEMGNTILVIRLDALGDVIMTIPLIRELKRNFPECRLSVAVQERFASLLEGDPDVDELLRYPGHSNRAPWKRLLRLCALLKFGFGHLRHRAFKWVISPRWDVDTHGATLLSVFPPAGKRLAYSERATPAKANVNHGFDRCFDVVLPSGPLQHEVIRNLEFVKVLGGSIRSELPTIHLAEHHLAFADMFLAQSDGAVWVAVGPGAQVATRCWPIERYCDVLLQLGKATTLRAVVVCGPAEEESFDRAFRSRGLQPIMLAKPDLKDAAAVLSRCALFIGNDSGPAHLAAAVSCPTIVISPHAVAADADHDNSPVRFAPRGPLTKVLQPMRCAAPCSTHCAAAGPHCILQITATQVVLAAQEYLASFMPVDSPGLRYGVRPT